MAFRVDSKLLYETTKILVHRVHIVCYGSFEKYLEDNKFERNEKSLQDYSSKIVDELFAEHRQQIIDDLAENLYNNLPIIDKGSKTYDE